MAGRKKKSSVTAKDNSLKLPGDSSNNNRGANSGNTVKRKTKKVKPGEKPPAVSNKDQPVVMILEPVITLAEVANLRDKFLEHMEASKIEIDASRVEHIDTGGLQLLLSVANSFKKKGGKITWTGWSAPCLSTAEHLGLTRLLEMKE